ncbi:MAG: alginate export family protein [Gemmatimonadetes bacterium]|nr:alginate export family protein [Gemmatimonadota bacterium]
MLAPNAGLTVKPVTALTLDGTVFRFARASAADALYNAGGGVERPAGAAVAKAVGTELDLTGTYRVGSRVVVLAGYSGLWAGDFIRETGAAGTISFAYSSLQVSY